MRLTKDNISEFVLLNDKDCWEWKYGKISTGYGAILLPNGKQILAHRLSYELFYGEVPSDKLVCHICDNPPCVNPIHLFLGTYKDNTQDMLSKGRAKGGPKYNRYCKRGHDRYNNATADGHCLSCMRVKSKRRRDKAKNNK